MLGTEDSRLLVLYAPECQVELRLSNVWLLWNLVIEVLLGLSSHDPVIASALIPPLRTEREREGSADSGWWLDFSLWVVWRSWTLNGSLAFVPLFTASRLRSQLGTGGRIPPGVSASSLESGCAGSRPVARMPR